jgi:hypothetical protein
MNWMDLTLLLRLLFQDRIYLSGHPLICTASEGKKPHQKKKESECDEKNCDFDRLYACGSGLVSPGPKCF